MKKPKISNEKKVTEALTSLALSIEKLESLAKYYQDVSDAARRRGEDTKADKLLMKKIRIDRMGARFATFRDGLIEQVTVSKAIGDLGKLPGAIDGCVKMLKEGPDFKKLGKKIKKSFEGLDDPDGPLNSFFNEMEKFFDEADTTVVRDTRLNAVGTEEDRALASAFQKELEVQKMRIVQDAGSVTAVPDIPVDATGDIDLASLISEENNKK